MSDARNRNCSLYLVLLNMQIPDSETLSLTQDKLVCLLTLELVTMDPCSGDLGILWRFERQTLRRAFRDMDRTINSSVDGRRCMTPGSSASWS